MGLTEKLTYQNDTVFSVDTDSYGNTMIGTRLTYANGELRSANCNRVVND